MDCAEVLLKAVTWDANCDEWCVSDGNSWPTRKPGVFYLPGTFVFHRIFVCTGNKQEEEKICMRCGCIVAPTDADWGAVFATMHSSENENFPPKHAEPCRPTRLLTALFLSARHCR